MKQLLVLLTFVAALGLLSGCGDDDCTPCSVPPIQEQPLAEVTRDTGGGGSGGFDSLRVTFHYSATTDTLLDIYVKETDEGYTFTIDETNNPDFTEAISILTNGEDDQMMLWVRFPSGSGGAIGTAESNFLKGGLTGEWDPDLAGAEVTKILLHLDDIYIDNQGDYTDYDIYFRIVFMGLP